jgi:hypothetical protein
MCGPTDAGEKELLERGLFERGHIMAEGGGSRERRQRCDAQ